MFRVVWALAFELCFLRDRRVHMFHLLAHQGMGCQAGLVGNFGSHGAVKPRGCATGLDLHYPWRKRIAAMG